MEKHSDEESALKQYLLGELDQEEQLLIEERLFLDNEYLLRLQTLSDELIDDYLVDELPVAERKKFETWFLSNHERQADFRFAKAFKRYCETEAGQQASTSHSSLTQASRSPAISWLSLLASPFSRQPIVSFSLAAAALLILCVALWLVLNFTFLSRPERSQPIVTQSPTPQPTAVIREQQPPAPDSGDVRLHENINGEAEQPDKRRNYTKDFERTEEKTLVAQRERNSRQPRGASTSKERQPSISLAVLLIPGGDVRGESRANIVQLPANLNSLILQLPLVEQDDYIRYEATLRTDNRTLRTWTGLKSTMTESIKIVPVAVPSKLLRQQGYQIKLTGITADKQAQEIATYSFQVEKR